MLMLVPNNLQASKEKDAARYPYEKLFRSIQVRLQHSVRDNHPISAARTAPLSPSCWI